MAVGLGQLPLMMIYYLTPEGQTGYQKLREGTAHYTAVHDSVGLQYTVYIPLEVAKFHNIPLLPWYENDWAREGN